MIECEVSQIVINEKSLEQVIVLSEKQGARSLTIVIGIHEASSIRIVFGGPKPPRPISHDLIKEIIDSLDGSLEAVVIDDVKEHTYFAKLLLLTTTVLSH